MIHSLKKVETAQDWENLHRIRKSVLFTGEILPQNYDENHPQDRAENNSPILFVFDNETIGVARLDQRDATGIIRLVAITKEWQSQGKGRILQELLEEKARQLGIKTLCVNAANAAIGFYEKTGWIYNVWDKSELLDMAGSAVQMQKGI